MYLYIPFSNVCPILLHIGIYCTTVQNGMRQLTEYFHNVALRRSYVMGVLLPGPQVSVYNNTFKVSCVIIYSLWWSTQLGCLDLKPRYRLAKTSGKSSFFLQVNIYFLFNW